MKEIEVEGVCTCGKVLKASRNISQIEIMETCVKAVRNSEVLRGETPELQKDYAISLFIQLSKDSNITKMQERKGYYR